MIPLVIHTIGGLVISALTKEMEEGTRDWFQDQEVCKYNSHGVLNNKPLSNLDPSTSVLWAVHSKSAVNSKHIGNVCLSNIDWISRKAEFSCIFGDKSLWGNGFATTAIFRLFDHGFNKLNLHKIWLGTAATNKAMIRIAEKLGMREEGVLVEDVFLEGRYVDIFRFGILKSDWILKGENNE